ncbi:ATP-binding protein [Natrialbaceae archaeon A-arb3/5]
MTEEWTDFVEETQERITNLNNALLTLEQSPDDEAAMENIFRIAHTVKGNCGAAGLESASDIAHAIEDLLDCVRSGTVDVTPELMDDVFAAVDELERIIEAADANGSDIDPSPTIQLLREHVETASITSVEAPSDDEVESVLSRFDPPADEDHDAYLTRIAIAETASTSEDATNGELVVDALIDAFDLIGTVPSRSRIEDGTYDGRFDAVFGCAVGETAIASGLEPVEEVADFAIVDVTGKLEATTGDQPVETPGTLGEDVAGADISTDEAQTLEVNDLLNEFDEFDDLEEKVKEVEADDDLDVFDEMGDAGSFDDLFDSADEPAEPDESQSPQDEVETDAEADEPADSDDDVEDAEAVFEELKSEVDTVGFDELQDELAELEFDEFDDEEEVSMDELLGDEAVETDDDPFFADTEPSDEDIDEMLIGADDEFESHADDSDGESEAGTAGDQSMEADQSAAVDPDASTTEVSSDDETVADHDSDEATADANWWDSAVDQDVSGTAESDDEVLDPDPPEEVTADDLFGDDIGDADESETATDDELETADETPMSATEGVDDDSFSDGDEAEFGADEAEFDADETEESDAGVDFDPTDDSFEDPPAEYDDEFDDSGFDSADASFEESTTEYDDEFEASYDEFGTSFGDDETEATVDGAFEEEDTTAASDAFDDSEPAATDTSDDPSVDPLDLVEESDDSFEETFGDDAFDEVEFDVESDDSFGDASSDDDDTAGQTDDDDVTRIVEEPSLEIPEITVPEPTAQPAPDEQTDETGSVRVDVDRLEELLTLVEGLVTSRVRLRHEVESGLDVQAIEAELDGLEDLTTDLQETVMDVRLVPLETVANRLPRVVRDIAREQHKEVAFELTGEGVELDRGVLDRIRDPLIHLVRNAVDHGIEPADEREAAGKPREGTVEVAATRASERVTITVTDDGRGLDPDTLRSEAVEAGVVSDAEAAELDDDEATQLIFESGLSTAEAVTDVSGRGVGMDVVKRTIEDLNGTVSIDSEPEQGTTVTMTLPVSIAIDDVLFVRCGDEEFGIPTEAVHDVESPSALETSDDGELVLPTEDESYPVVQLGDALDIPGDSGIEGEPDADDVIIRIREGVRPVALHCNRVHGQQEVVVKPFEGFLSGVPGLGGATVRGRGKVVTILDVTTL